METIEEIIEQEPLVEESQHTHQRNLRHHQHHHHHNGSVVMVNTQTGQLMQHQRLEMNNNGLYKKIISKEQLSELWKDLRLSSRMLCRKFEKNSSGSLWSFNWNYSVQLDEFFQTIQTILSKIRIYFWFAYINAKQLKSWTNLEFAFTFIRP